MNEESRDEQSMVKRSNTKLKSSRNVTIEMKKQNSSGARAGSRNNSKSTRRQDDK